MKKILQSMVGLLVGISLSVAVAAPTAAVELGPKATLIVTNVQTRMATATSSLRANEAILRANAAEAFPQE